MDELEKAAIYRLHAEFCKTLADANRLLIINELAKGELSVGELTERLGLKQPNVSKHLALNFEGLYQIAVFDNFTDCQVQDSHFPLGDPEGDLFPEYAYAIEEVSLTGISLQAGIKLLF